METDQLIRTLAADNAHRVRPVGLVLTLALLAAAPVSLVMFLAGLGVRPDVMTSETGAAASSSSASTNPTGRTRCALSAAMVRIN
jgi:hypothetical protein